MAGSQVQGTNWATVKRSVIPGFAASDIVQGAAVCMASGTGEAGFIMATGTSQKPVGVARDHAIAGNPVAILDFGNEVRTNVGGLGAGQSFTSQSFVGIVGTSTVVHPQSGVTVTVGLYGPVTANGSAVGAAGGTLYAVGVGYEGTAVGDFGLFRVEPTILSGLVGM